MVDKIKSQSSTSKKNIYIISIIGIVISFWYFYGGGLERGVASNEIKQYEMCMRNNDYTGASAHAGIVSAAYQQAGDEGNYRKWKTLSDEALQKAINIEKEKYK